MCMKRLILTLSLLLVAGAAHAFDPSPSDQPVRIGILRAPGAYYYENAEYVHRAVTAGRVVSDVAAQVDDVVRSR